MARRSTLALLLGALTAMLAWQGGGDLQLADDGCRCEEASSLESSPLEHQGSDGAHETCPPRCDGCACCGSSAPVVAASAGATVGPVAARRAAVIRWTTAAAPRGEPGGVFRPPRG